MFREPLIYSFIRLQLFHHSHLRFSNINVFFYLVLFRSMLPSYDDREPEICFRITLGDSFAVSIKHSEVLLRTDISLFGRFAEPYCCLRIILLNTLPIVIEQAEGELCLCVSLLCRFAKPNSCLCVVLRFALPIVIKSAEIVLSIRVGLFCRFAKPYSRLIVILRYGYAFEIEHTKSELRPGM